MSRSAEVRIEFGGELRTFRLAIAEHRRLQEKLDVGVSLIAERLHPYVSAIRANFSFSQTVESRLLGDIRPDHVRELIFEGLVGGGATPDQAGKLVRTWVDCRPVLEAVPAAYAIALAALIGAEDEQASDPGEPTGEGGPRSPEASSVSARTASTP